MRYKAGDIKIHNTAKALAEMFYKALKYEGAIYNIDVAIYDNTETSTTDTGMMVHNNYKIYCNKKKPHTLNEFVSIATSQEVFPIFYIVASLDKADKRRITIMSLPKELWHIAQAPAILSTIGFEPNWIETTLITDFLEFIEG